MSKDKFTIKNKVTGHEFVLTKEECDKLVVEEPHNFEVIDEDYISPIPKNIEETSTYNKVVVDDKTDEEKQKEAIRKELIDEYEKEGKTWEGNALEEAIQTRFETLKAKKALEDKTVPELKALCDEKKIEYAKNAKKAELVELLMKG